ncbi:MAG: hypothetical protein R2715_03110 [Ilumatobacteraceae bacterium]
MAIRPPATSSIPTLGSLGWTVSISTTGNGASARASPSSASSGSVITISPSSSSPHGKLPRSRRAWAGVSTLYSTTWKPCGWSRSTMPRKRMTTDGSSKYGTTIPINPPSARATVRLARDGR